MEARLFPPHPALSLAAAIAVALGSGAAVGDESAGKPPTYEEHVLPIFREKCCGCHNADRKSGGLDLTSYAQMLAGGNSGDVLEPGDPEGSYLWQLASHESEPTMPPEADPIPDAMLAVITKWIAGGIVERDGSKPVAVKPAASLALDPGAVVVPQGEAVMPPPLPREPLSHGIRPAAVTAIAASPHGELIAIGGRRQLLLAHTSSLELLGVLPFPEGRCRSVRFSRNAKLLLAAGGVPAKSGRVVIWDVATAKRVMELGEEYDEILAADISADQRLVALGGPSRVVRLLTTADGGVESTITKHTDWVTAVAFSPDSVLLATGDRAGNLFLWESFGAREWGVLAGHTAAISSVAWRPDGLVLASGSEDGTIHLWDAEGPRKIRSFKAHAADGGGTLDVRFLPDGRLLSTGRDRKVKLWKSDGKLERQIGSLPSIGTCVAISFDGARFFAADAAGNLVAWQASDGSPAGSIDTNPAPK